MKSGLFTKFNSSEQLLFSICALTGTHGSGKTTAFELIRNTLNLCQITYIPDLARLCPFPVGFDTNMKAELWILSEQIRRECESSIAICDKCLVDNYAYTVYFYGRIKKVEDTILPYIRRYSRIIKLSPNHTFLVDDGLRPTNISFQLEIDSIIEQLISIWEIEVTRIDFELGTEGESQLIKEVMVWLRTATEIGQI